MGILDDIREKVEAEHLEAIRALQVLERYLTQSTAKAGIDGSAKAEVADQPEGKKTSIKEQVLAVIRTRWASTAEIHQVTGLNPKQIRGVLNSSSAREEIDRKEVDGQMVYKLKTDRFAH